MSILLICIFISPFATVRRGFFMEPQDRRDESLALYDIDPVILSAERLPGFFLGLRSLLRPALRVCLLMLAYACLALILLAVSLPPPYASHGTLGAGALNIRTIYNMHAKNALFVQCVVLST